jgi:methyltransferase (TIGR00027 family)
MSRRIESKTSRTAEFTCLARCLSYLEEREQYKSDDYVSLVIMNGLIRQLLRFPLFRRKFMDKNPPGMYEYVIARTKTIDAEFKRALEQGFEQILIFGAGFDSRGIRLGSKARNTRIFELDAPATQSAKIKRYRQKKIGIPENLVFIPIDFERESLPERLLQEGYEKGRPSLFILEGLTMYLQPESVDSTFRVIEEFAGSGSRVVFDHIYASVVRRENLYEGEQELYNNVADNGERFCFGIEKGNIGQFLGTYGFKAEKTMDADALEDMFFRNARGQLVGRVNKTHCMVTAVKK